MVYLLVAIISVLCWFVCVGIAKFINISIFGFYIFVVKILKKKKEESLE